MKLIVTAVMLVALAEVTWLSLAFAYRPKTWTFAALVVYACVIVWGMKKLAEPPPRD